jgi:hypothetical protein
MFKLCRNLPRASVGFLGLVLVLTCTAFNAKADTLRRGGIGQTTTQGGMMFGVPAGVSPATASPSALPSVQEFSVAGSGNINFAADPSVCTNAGLSCNAGETCQCLQLTGAVTDGIGPLFHGAASLILNIVTTFPTRQYPNGNTAGQTCFFASGVLTITPAVTSGISFITSGAACNGTNGGVALYSGGFEIGPSTGGFSNAVGGGTLGFGSHFNTDVGIFDLKGAGSGLN